MESSDTHFDALENNLLAETPPSDQPPFEILKIVLWVIIAILCLLYLYSFILMLRLFKILKFYTQKVLIQTILYINLSLLFRIGYFLCFELYFYDQSITPWKHSWYLTLILGTNAFTVLSFLFIFFQWLAFKIVSEIQISGNYHEYKPRIRTKNFFLSVSTGFILILSLCLMSVMLVVDDKYSGQIESAMRLFLTVIIFFTVIALSMVCVKLLATLELHYRNFYLQNRGFILGMTLALIASSIVRVGNIIYEDGMTNGWFMPTYFGLHFFLVDFLSSGALLLNFGFTIQNKKQVVQVETQDRWGQKLMQRRETFLNIEDSDEDEEEGGSGVYVDTQTNENPFQLKAKLGGKLDSSPISSPHSNGGDSPDFGGRFNRFFRGLTKQNRASSKRKRQLTESQKVPGPTIQ
ncbi:hypothetical protein FGO68_gene4263 [Halteria grandinella]|uniref:Uncharacterized protein n=1 Tax=Halteria grandinella TaxID=5974 RepID=A0A8J8NQH0_HALGN|nr:hypothetical protein FGO68_gene4263 [Halteria grandinella]